MVVLPFCYIPASMLPSREVNLPDDGANGSQQKNPHCASSLAGYIAGDSTCNQSFQYSLKGITEMIDRTGRRQDESLLPSAADVLVQALAHELCCLCRVHRTLSFLNEVCNLQLCLNSKIMKLPYRGLGNALYGLRNQLGITTTYNLVDWFRAIRIRTGARTIRDQ